MLQKIPFLDDQQRAELNLKTKQPTWKDTKRPMQYPAKKVGFSLVILAILLVFSIGCRRVPDRPVTFRQKIEMEQYDIWPEVIRIPLGSSVEFTVTSNDVEHGLAVDGLGISEPVQPGRTTIIHFLADKPGTYTMRCSVLCGRGHKKMLGQIIIQ